VTVRTALLSQRIEELPTGKRVRETVEEVSPVIEVGRGRQLTASQLLDRFGFTGEKQWTPVGDLSGGERRRLQLLRLLMTEPNVFLLDEPTNDLDIDTLNALEDLLDGWPGSLLVVSHDRYFLERTTDRIVALLGDGRLAYLPGGVDEYLRRRAACAPAATPAPTAAPAPSAARDSRAAKKGLARLERRLDKLVDQEAELHGKLAARASDYQAVAALDEQLRVLRAERESLEEQWLELADEA
jgi:ATP-binding cassette subfamily F protein uup